MGYYVRHINIGYHLIREALIFITDFIQEKWHIPFNTYGSFGSIEALPPQRIGLIPCAKSASSQQLRNFGSIGALFQSPVKYYLMVILAKVSILSYASYVNPSFVEHSSSRISYTNFCFLYQYLDFLTKPNICWVHIRQYFSYRLYCCFVEVEGRSIEAFSIFKKGIRPEWEDVVNRTGGELICR